MVGVVLADVLAIQHNFIVINILIVFISMR